MAEYTLQTPLTDEAMAKLRAGDVVRLTGTIYTARDAAHKRLIDLLDKAEPLPFDLKGSVIYYVGPSPRLPAAPSARPGPPPAIAWTPTPRACIPLAARPRWARARGATRSSRP